MKILQISPKVPIPLNEGGKIGIYGITKYLYKLGHQIDLVVYRNDSDYKSSYEELALICNPIILDIHVKNDLFEALINIFSPVPYNIYKFKKKILKKCLIKYFLQNSPDVVHVDHLHMSWVIEILRKVSNVPVILREHNVELLIMKRFAETQTNIVLKWYAYLQYKKFLKYEPTQCEKFECCAMITIEDELLIKKLNPSIKTKIIPAGVDENLLEIQIPDSFLPYSMFHIGSLKWLPNLDGLRWFLNQVMPELIERQPLIKLFVYGKGSDKLEIPDILADNVIPGGFPSNLFKEIINKQLAIVPLRVGGGMRIKIIELLAGGKNIVSTSIGKEGIQVIENTHILIADTREEFIQKILEYFENFFDNKRMIENGRLLIREKYTWDHVAKEFEAAYLEEINSRVKNIKASQ